MAMILLQEDEPKRKTRDLDIALLFLTISFV